MRIAIVGSRTYPKLEEVRSYVSMLPSEAVIISGGARGVDVSAVDEAFRHGLKCVEFLPDYDAHGKDAPKLRNKLIAHECDRMVAFWDGKSGGTANAIAWAIAYGRPVEVRL